ncbi:MAG TPA: hypothetical protein VN176_06720, partial [Verrucomicrobiae bacterium]|nr:hypothetical protein [Verrucomicrobiae bacterium]
KRMSAELRQLDELLKSETEAELQALGEFREELDKVRLTAWSAAELLKAKRSKCCVEAEISFVSAERLRQLEQMVRDVCVHIDRAGVQQTGMQSFFASMQTLHEEMVLQREKYPAWEPVVAGRNGNH